MGLPFVTTVKITVTACLRNATVFIAAVRLVTRLWTELPVTVPCLVTAVFTLAVVRTMGWHTSVLVIAMAV